jgi:hypothetical protein
MPKKIYKTKKTVVSAGKNSKENIETNLEQIKRSTGATPRRRKGAIIRKPIASIRSKAKGINAKSK